MRILAILSGAFLFGASSLSAQIQITKSDMPVPGKAYTQTQAMPSSLDLMLDQKGPDQKWDYSGLSGVSQSTDAFQSMNDVSPMYKAYFLTNQPNLVMPQNMSAGGMDSLVPIMPSNMLAFLKSQSSSLSVIGVGFEASGFPVGVPYEHQDVIFTFPLSFKKRDSSASSYTISFPGIGYYHHEQQRRWGVDGWGKIKTPFGEWDALRVRTIIESTDSVYLDTLHNGSKIYPPVQVEYQWLANGIGQAVLTISGNEMGGAFMPTSISYMDTPWHQAGIYTPSLKENPLAIYPNPARDLCRVNNPGPTAVKAELLDITGRSLEQIKLEPGVNTLSLDNLKPGTYFLRTQDNFGMQAVKLIRM